MIMEGATANLLETTQRAFRNQSQSKQRSTLHIMINEYISEHIFVKNGEKNVNSQKLNL